MPRPQKKPRKMSNPTAQKNENSRVRRVNQNNAPRATTKLLPKSQRGKKK